MANKTGPKEAALRAQRESHPGVPDFLKRTETPEQAAKRDAKYAKKETDPKLKVIEPYNPNDPIRKAIAKDLADDSMETIVKAHGNIAPDTKPDDLPSCKTPNKKRQKKPSPLLAKAIAEAEKRNQPKHTAEANPMEADMAKKKVAKKSTAKKSNGAVRKNGSYDWAAAEAMAKAGKIPPLPSFRSYAPHTKQMHELAKKKDVAGIKKFSAEFKDEKGARANLFRFRDLCLTALRK